MATCKRTPASTGMTEGHTDGSPFGIRPLESEATSAAGDHNIDPAGIEIAAQRDAEIESSMFNP